VSHEVDVECKEGCDKKVHKSGCQELSEENVMEAYIVISDELASGQNNDESKSDDSINKKKEEDFVVVVTNAIIDPWTMMIHSQNALLANSAMMSSIRLEE
jgi:hypothetical protein